jgi:very-short-patch-repair endonuclease
MFDAASEFYLYKDLVEMFGEKYYIFPQVGYSHLMKVKDSVLKDWGHRSRIDKKTADFVVCDKDRVVPKLVIELDGPVHGYKDRQARDNFIDDAAKSIGLPILHIRTGSSKEFVRSEIIKILN